MAIDERISDEHGLPTEIAGLEAGAEQEQDNAPGFDDAGFLAAKKAEKDIEQEKREEEARIAAEALRRYRLKQDGGLR